MEKIESFLCTKRRAPNLNQRLPHRILGAHCPLLELGLHLKHWFFRLPDASSAPLSSLAESRRHQSLWSSSLTCRCRCRSGIRSDGRFAQSSKRKVKTTAKEVPYPFWLLKRSSVGSLGCRRRRQDKWQSPSDEEKRRPPRKLFLSICSENLLVSRPPKKDEQYFFAACPLVPAARRQRAALH